MRYRISNWLIGFLSFVGMLSVLLFDAMGDVSLSDTAIRVSIAIFSFAFFLSFIYEYFVSHRTSNALTELTKTITDIEQDIAVSLNGQDDSYYIMSISNILNMSLVNLKEKNTRLESEMQRNQRLSENIHEFYRQMKSLRETDFKFDFYEFDVQHSIFVFIIGLSTFMENEDISEITIDDLYHHFQVSIRKDEFKNHIRRCVEENVPLNFECSITQGSSAPHWLKFWGRVCEDKTRITGAITEITREVIQRNLEKERAIHDNITGFYNRNALSEIGGRALSENRPGEMVVFSYLGLNGYQEFQERYGMVAGNTYIRTFAEVFKKFIHDSLIPFRWWGSDFLLIFRNVTDLDAFRNGFRNIMRRIEKYMSEVDGIAVTFPVTSGYAVSGLHGDTPSELLEYASFAQHEALRGAVENPNPFNRDRFEEVKRASLRRTFIKDIIDKNQLSVVFQPIVSLKTGELFGFEALSRPLNPIYRNIVELIDDAEASGHYIILEKRMVYNALDAYMLRHEKFRDHYLFINTAPYATLDEKDYNDIRDRYFGHMRVVFEVVERNRMEPEEINLRKSIVTKAGAKFALDDFGSGYSNHLALLALEPDIIKLDKELVRGIHHDLNKQYMIEDIISYARYRGTRVLAEGIETRDELETLCRMGVDYAQGYFLGMPSPDIAEPYEKAQEFIRAMRKRAQLDLTHIFTIITGVYAEKDPQLSANTVLSAFLVSKMAERLGIEGDKMTRLMMATFLHDIGSLYPDCKTWRNDTGASIPDHAVFAYQIMKRFGLCTDYAKAVLYHHYQYDSPEKTLDICIPDESYLISFADAAADLILKSDAAVRDADEILHAIKQAHHHPRHVNIFADLLGEGILDGFNPEACRETMCEYLHGLPVVKKDLEGMIRMLVYTLALGNPYAYRHAMMVETTVGLLARLTRQNWRLVEKIRMASLLFNMARLPINPSEMGSYQDESDVIRKALDPVAEVVRKAGLTDILDILITSVGGNVLSDNSVLMGKDIIMGSRMIILSDRFASLLEDRSERPGMSCPEAIEELKRESDMDGSMTAILEVMEDYAEDLEGAVAALRSEMDAGYRGVILSYMRLKSRISSRGNLKKSQ